MTSSRSKNRLLLVVGTILLITGFGMRAAHADRKRVVVLPLEGEKADKIRESLVKLLKKSHSVVSKDKWATTADDMGASSVTDKNIKKVAKKMRVDGVIEGTITKKGDEYVLKLKLRAGKDGKVTANVSTKSETTKLDGDAAKDIKNELISAINGLESGGDDSGDDDAKPAKKDDKKGKKDDDDDKSAKKDDKKGKKDDDKKGKKDDDDDAKTAKKDSKFGNGAMKKDGDDDTTNAMKSKKDDGDDKKKDDGDEPVKTKKGKKVAKKGGDDDSGGEIKKGGDEPGKMDAAEALSTANRAIDATVGLSLVTRRLAWNADGDLAPSSLAGAGMGKPPNYKGVPAPGAIVDVTVYPMAFSHKETGITKDIGLNFIFDRALLISSKSGGEELKTQAQRYLIGPVFRYPLGKGPGAPVVGGMLRYGSQLFTIDGADIPNVNYGMIVPGAFFKIGFGKITINAQANFALVTKAGPVSRSDEYGGTKGTGYSVDLGADYMLAPNLFARGGIRFDSITTKFDGTGMKTTMRDGDPEQDVQGAKDTYIGVAATVGFLY